MSGWLLWFVLAVTLVIWVALALVLYASKPKDEQEYVQ